MPTAQIVSDVRIRLQRFGRKRFPFYRIVATHKYAPRDGKFHEILGTYNPTPDRYGAKHVTFNVERLKYWLVQGAAPSERVMYLLGRSELVPPVPRRQRSLLVRRRHALLLSRTRPPPLPVACSRPSGGSRLALSPDVVRAAPFAFFAG